ncbi:MAG: serine/threonine protein kinase [Myxococcales bacterium]|nr:serine/threonine protein kinase [Myxococcales bacterium]
MADMLIGVVLADRYKLLSRIGEGAMGWVFLAEHVEIGKKVAIKVLRPSLCRLPEAVSRFRREARSATQIGSKHIVDVTDFGTTDTGSVYFVMEHLQGEDLGSLLKANKFLPWPRVLHFLEQLCEALQAAHDTGIIHRDVKPANFYRVEQDGDPDFIKILDFGIARLANPQDSIVTQTGVVMGTPDFMAPEQAMGKHVDHRADVYSLGASAYALLTGRPPFEGANEYDVIYKQLNDDPAPPSEVAPVAAKLPKWVDAIILKALRKNPEDRFASMKEFAEAIRKARAKAERSERPAKAEGSESEAAEPSSGRDETAEGSLAGREVGLAPMVWVWAAVGLVAAAAAAYALAQ